MSLRPRPWDWRHDKVPRVDDYPVWNSDLGGFAAAVRWECGCEFECRTENVPALGRRRCPLHRVAAVKVLVKAVLSSRWLEAGVWPPGTFTPGKREYNLVLMNSRKAIQRERKRARPPSGDPV